MRGRGVRAESGRTDRGSERGGPAGKDKVAEEEEGSERPRTSREDRRQVLLGPRSAKGVGRVVESGVTWPLASTQRQKTKQSNTH